MMGGCLENGVEDGRAGAGDGDAATAIMEKLLADLHALRTAVARCGSCPGGGKGVPGCGEPGADVLFLAGRPGPGASAEDPWGDWREQLVRKVEGEWGWDLSGAYFSTALRCPPRRVTRNEVRRCAGFLAEELFIVGPRLVVVSGKVAAVALREAMGDEIPASPKAGDIGTAFSMRLLFELDVARIAREKEAASVFWSILKNVEDTLPGVITVER